MAETLLAAGPRAGPPPERHQLVVHVDASVLADPETPGRCQRAGGGRVAAHVARRLSCDGTLTGVLEDRRGHPLDVGRRTRAISPALRRALEVRDGGCRFPGCTRVHRVEGHHVRHWAAGGETALANLVSLCRTHHPLVHEGGYTVEAVGDGEFRFRRPDGTPLEAPPPPAVDGDLESRAARAGVAIDHGTARCTWDDARVDVAMAVEGLLDRDPAPLVYARGREARGRGG